MPSYRKAQEDDHGRDQDQQGQHDRNSEVSWLDHPVHFLAGQIKGVLFKAEALVDQGHGNLEQLLHPFIEGDRVISRDFGSRVAEDVGPDLGGKLAVQVAAAVKIGLLSPVLLHVDHNIEGSACLAQAGRLGLFGILQGLDDHDRVLVRLLVLGILLVNHFPGVGIDDAGIVLDEKAAGPGHQGKKAD